MRIADEDARNLARAEMQTGLYKRSMRLRRGVERLFADAKAKRGLTRLHLRGIRGAEEEFQLAAAMSNLLLLARPAERVRRPNRVRAAQRRISDMERVSRGGVELACRQSAATVHRRVVAVARERGWRAPSYSSVHAIMAGLDPVDGAIAVHSLRRAP